MILHRYKDLIPALLRKGRDDLVACLELKAAQYKVEQMKVLTEERQDITKNNRPHKPEPME